MRSTRHHSSATANYAPLDSAWDIGSRSSETGLYAGVGPKAYRRSDDRIVEDVNDELTRHPHVDATDIDVTCHQGQVTLAGRVRSRDCRRAAEDAAYSRSGVRDVQNNLRVELERENADQTAGIDDVAAWGMKDNSGAPNY